MNLTDDDWQAIADDADCMVWSHLKQAVNRRLAALAATRAEPVEPVAWVDDLSRSQPHCVTGLQYLSAADAEAGKAYIPLYAAPQVARAEPAGGRINYEPLHAFAETNRVSYNELCAAVRASLAAPPSPACDGVSAARQLLAAVDAELSDDWVCNSYHPSLRPAAENLRAVLAATEGGDGVSAEPPKGWKLVPLEPTPEMVRACNAGPGGMVLTSPETYRAMLEAAPPAPPVGGADREDAAARDVLAERRRQVEAEGWDAKHDDRHNDGSLALAAACYASNAGTWLQSARFVPRDRYKDLSPGVRWPWSAKWWKPSNERRDLVKAGALILAEIERLDRAARSPASAGEGA